MKKSLRELCTAIAICFCATGNLFATDNQINTDHTMDKNLNLIKDWDKVFPQSNGGIAPTFNVIQMNYSNLHKLLGGSLHYKKEDLEKKTPIGWTAPSEVLVMQGPWELSLVSGQSVLIPNATLLSNPAGKLTLTETSKIEVTLEVAMPEDGSQPYGVFDTEAIPDEWGQYKLPPAEAAAAASLQSEEG